MRSTGAASALVRAGGFARPVTNEMNCEGSNMNRSSSPSARLSTIAGERWCLALQAKGKTIDDTADFFVDSHGGSIPGFQSTVDRNPVRAFFTIFLSAWTRSSAPKQGNPVRHGAHYDGNTMEIDNSGQDIRCYRLCQSDS